MNIRKPLAGKLVLNTRPAEIAQSLTKLLAEQDAEVLECPMLVFKPPSSWEACDKFYQQLQPEHWVVFTSAIAIKRLAERLIQQTQPLEKLNLSSLASIGPSTAETLAEYQLKATLISKISKQENLLEHLLQSLPPTSTLWIPRALQARSVLEDGLQQAGHQVHIVPVYQTAPPKSGLAKAESAIMEGRLDWLVFTSSQAVSHFIDSLSSATRNALRKYNPRTACLGSITSETARLHGLRVAAQPSQQNMTALVQIIVQVEIDQSTKTLPA